MKKEIKSEKAPAAIGPYSQAVDSGEYVFVSGMLGLDPATGALAEGIEAQAERGLENLKAALEEAGLTTDNVVKTTVFLTDLKAFGAVNEIYARYFKAPFPARSCVQVGALPKGGDFEIEAIARR